MNVTRTQLDNGLRVILSETHTAPVASLIYLSRQPQRTARSHRHQPLGGAHALQGHGHLSRSEFDKAVAPPEGRLQRHDQPRLDDLLRDLSVGSHRTGAASGKRPHGQFALRRQETELERTVILSEREGSENSYFWLLNEEVTAAAFQEHAYRHPIIGWRGDLHTMQRDDLFRHYRTFYTAQRGGRRRG
ncbi:MAG: hypothetical protein R2838_18040 [Caldilineaceae bacterium]